MERLLFCTHDPMLRKGLYGPLMDDGHQVEWIEHPADAVRLVLQGRWRTRYRAVVLDSDGIGLDARDAAGIIRRLSPGIHVFIIGQADPLGESFTLDKPVDVDRLRNLLRSVLIYT